MCANVTVEEPGSEFAMKCIDGLSADLPINYDGSIMPSDPFAASGPVNPLEDVGLGPLKLNTRPYTTYTCSFACGTVFGGEKVPDSTIAQDVRLALTTAFRLVSVSTITSLVEGLLRFFSPGHAGTAVATPTAFNDLVNTGYSGKAGLPDYTDYIEKVKNGVQEEHMANIFQNTWAGQFLTYSDGKYHFTCDTTVLSKDPADGDGGNQPILDAMLNPAYGGGNSLLAGGTRDGTRTFTMEDGKLTYDDSSGDNCNINGERGTVCGTTTRYPMTHCLHNAIQ